MYILMASWIFFFGLVYWLECRRRDGQDEKKKSWFFEVGVRGFFFHSLAISGHFLSFSFHFRFSFVWSLRDCFLADLEINLPFILYLFILGIYVKWVVLGMVKRLGERKRVRERG